MGAAILRALDSHLVCLDFELSMLMEVLPYIHFIVMGSTPTQRERERERSSRDGEIQFVEEITSTGVAAILSKKRYRHFRTVSPLLNLSMFLISRDITKRIILGWKCYYVPICLW